MQWYSSVVEGVSDSGRELWKARWLPGGSFLAGGRELTRSKRLVLYDKTAEAGAVVVEKALAPSPTIDI